MAILTNSELSISSESQRSPEYTVPEIEPTTDLGHFRRVHRDAEPAEEAAQAWEEPESWQSARSDAPDAGLDERPASDRRLARGRSRG
jgi:hypothetical protein